MFAYFTSFPFEESPPPHHFGGPPFHHQHHGRRGGGCGGQQQRRGGWHVSADADGEPAAVFLGGPHHGGGGGRRRGPHGRFHHGGPGGGRFHGRFHHHGGRFCHRGAGAACEGVHVLEKSDKEVKLQFDVPGVKKDDLSLIYKHGVLFVDATRRVDDTEIPIRYRFPLRKYDATTAEFNIADGVLTFSAQAKEAQDAIEVPVVIGEPPEDATVIKEVDLPGVELDNIQVTFNGFFFEVHGSRVVGDETTTTTRKLCVRRCISAVKGYLSHGVLFLTGTIEPPLVLHESNKAVAVDEDGDEPMVESSDEELVIIDNVEN